MALLEKNVGRRNFLKGSAAAAVAMVAASLAGCSPSDSGEKLGSTGSEDVTPHVVESDTAILEGKGKWQGLKCPKGCSFACAPVEYVVDGVPIRSKPADCIQDDGPNMQYRGCHAFKTARRWIYGPSRIKYPMKRKNWEPGGDLTKINGELRGKDEWVRISWDEAIDICASEIKRIFDTYGPTSTFSMGGGNDGVMNVLSSMGGYYMLADTISNGVWQDDTAWFGLPYYGNGQGVDAQDYKNADYMIMAGQDYVFTSPTICRDFLNAKEAGTRFVYIGPCYNQGARQIGARWVPVRPGTDTALWNGVAYEMIKLDEEKGDIIDWDFLKKYTVGFTMDNMPADAKLEECYQGYLLGEYDGVPKTAEWASEICGASVQDIKDLAEILGKKNNVFLTTSNGASRNIGVENYPQVIHAIGCMGGHMGRSGNGVFTQLFMTSAPSLAKSGAQGIQNASAVNPLMMEKEPGANVGGIPSTGLMTIPAPLHWRSMLEGKFTSYGINPVYGGPGQAYQPGTEHEIDIKFIWNGGRNHLNTRVDVFNGVKVYRQAEFVLTQAIWASTPALYSDIVLPVCSSWEGSLDQAENVWPSGTINQYSGRNHLASNYPVGEPLWESRSDARICRDIAEKLGIDPDTIANGNALQKYFMDMAGANYTTENDEQAPLITLSQEVLDRHGIPSDVVAPQEAIVDFDKFVEDGGYYVSRSEGDAYSQVRNYGAFIDDPEANPLGSASGKWEIYCQKKADNFNTCDFADKEQPAKPYPSYFVPTSGYEKTFSDWDNKVKGDYPYLLYTFHPARGSHSDQWNEVGKEIYPHSLYMNPVDAEELGLAEGDTARVWNPEGGCILRIVTLMEGTMPGCVGLAEGGNLDLDDSDPDTWIDRGGCANVVTRAIRSNYMPALSGYNNSIVNIEKWTGDPLVPDCERDPFAIDEN